MNDDDFNIDDYCLRCGWPLDQCQCQVELRPSYHGQPFQWDSPRRCFHQIDRLDDRALCGADFTPAEPTEAEAAEIIRLTCIPPHRRTDADLTALVNLRCQRCNEVADFADELERFPPTS